MSGYSKTVVSLKTFKDALIYFDNVIPLTAMPEMVFDAKSPEQPREPSFFKDLLAQTLPPKLINSREFLLTFTDLQLELLRHIGPVVFGDEYPVNEGPELEPKRVVQLLSDFKLNEHPFLVPETKVSKEPDAATADISVTIASLNLVDTRKTSFEHILEFRRDSEARDRLRRLRLFAYENYLDKPAGFIEDDLLTRISDYEAAARKWSFETRSAAFTALLDSKLIAGGVAGSFVSTYFHCPLGAIATVAGAVGLAIAKVVIEIGRQQFAYREYITTNRVSYISYAREKLHNE